MGIIKEFRFQLRFSKVGNSPNTKSKGGAGEAREGWNQTKSDVHTKSARKKKEIIKGAVGTELGGIGKLGLYAVAIPLDFPVSVAVSQGRSQSGGVEAWHFGTIVTIATPMEFQNKSFELQSSV